MALNIFIIGPSGCGKTTQAKLIAEKYKLHHLSMGQLLRDEIAAGSEIGLKAKSYVDSGVWAPDDLVLDILFQKLQSLNGEDFIVDGFPRVLNQGRNIEHFLTQHHEPFTLLIHLDVTFQEIMARRERLGQEFQDKGRTDNTPEDIANRQKSYEDTIHPILDFFEAEGKLFRTDGNRPVDPIFQDICQKIDSLNS